MEPEIIEVRKRCRPAAGSVRLVYIIVPEDVTADGMPQTFILPLIAYAPTLDAGAKPIGIPIDRNTAIFSENKNTGNRAGDYYDRKLSFQIREMRYEVDYIREMLKNRRFHLLLEDYNKRVRFVKNCRVQEDATTGDKYLSKNGYTFNFFGRSETISPTIPVETIVFSEVNNNNGGNNNGSVSSSFSFTRLPEIQDGDFLLFAKTNAANQLIGFQWLPSGEYMRHIRGVVQSETSHLNGIGYQAANNVRIVKGIDPDTGAEILL